MMTLRSVKLQNKSLEKHKYRKLSAFVPQMSASAVHEHECVQCVCASETVIITPLLFRFK